MIAPADHRSQDYPRFKREVEGLLRRIRLPDEAQNAIATLAQLHAALKDIYDRFQDPLGGAIEPRLVRGAAFAQGATFSVCSAVGAYLSTGQPMDVDLEGLVARTAQKGILATEQAMGVWDYYLDISDEYLDALLLIRECPADASPGTNLDESYHSVLWRNRALKGRKSFGTTEMEIDMTARHFSHGVLESQFLPSNDAGPDNEAGAPAHKRRRRICRCDVSIKVIASALRGLAQGGSQDLYSDWKRSFFAMQASNWPGTDYASLQARGFSLRISSRSPLTEEEKATVKDAIMSLATEGPSVMGKYKYVANWVSVVHLGGRRSRLQVSSFIRSLVQECHAKALERGATVHPVPTSLLLTQDVEANAEVEADRDDAPEPEEHEYDSDEFF